MPPFSGSCSGHLPRLRPGLERRPQAAIETKTVDRRGGIDGPNPAKPDTGPLETALLKHAARRRVADAGSGLQQLMAQLAEGVVNHGANCLGRVAASPKGNAEPITELGAVRGSSPDIPINAPSSSIANTVSLPF